VSAPQSSSRSKWTLYGVILGITVLSVVLIGLLLAPLSKNGEEQTTLTTTESADNEELRGTSATDTAPDPRLGTTPMGDPKEATYIKKFQLYFYDTGLPSTDIEVEPGVLVVRLETMEQEFGPFERSDYSVVDEKGVSHPAVMVDIGGIGFWCASAGAKPATHIDTLTRKDDGASISLIAFKGVPPNTQRVKFCYGGKETELHVGDK